MTTARLSHARPLAVAMLAATIVRTPFCDEQKDCATCYNGSGKVSSQHLLSARPSPSLPFQSPESLPLFAFIRWPPERKSSMPFPPPRIRSFVPLCVLLFLHRKAHLAGHSSSIYLISSKKMLI